MEPEQLQLIKDITSNISVIVAALIGAFTTVIIGVIQSKYKAKQSKYEKIFDSKKEALEDYLKCYYSFEAKSNSDEKWTRKFNLKESQGKLMLYLSKEERELLKNATTNLLYNSKTNTLEDFLDKVSLK